jgi:hypothetical protein
VFIEGIPPVRARFLGARILCVAALLAWAGPAGAVELDFGIAMTLEHLSLPVPNPGRPIVCHGFGCAYQTPIQLRPGDIAQIRKFLGTAEDAIDERRGLAATMAWFERRVAGEAGTATAKARAGLGSAGDPSQFDCLDKTTNTIGVLLVVAQLGLLRFHAIDAPESRGGIGSLPHTSAVVREKESGQKWVIDGWTHNNGEYPDIMKLEKWRSQS